MMADIFGNANTKVEKFSVYKGDPRKIDVLSNGYIVHEGLREIDGAEKASEKARLAEVASKDKAMFKRFECVTDSYINEARAVNNIASMKSDCKTYLFKRVLCELYTKSLLIDDDFIARNRQSINSTVEGYVDNNGGFALLENAIARTNSHLLKKIRTICEETAKEVCDRKTKECMSANGTITGDADVFRMTPKEEEKFEYKTNEINPDEIAELVQKKVLTVVQDESESNKKHTEAIEEIEEAIKDDLTDEDESDDEDDKDDKKSKSKKDEDKESDKKSKKDDDEDDEDESDDDKDDKKSKSKKDDDDDDDDFDEYEDNKDDESDDEDDKDDKKSKSKKDDDNDSDDDDDKESDKKSKKDDDEDDDDDKKSDKKDKKVTEDDVKEAYHRIVIKDSPIQESTLFHAFIHNAYHEALTENLSGGYMVMRQDDEFDETYDINADRDDAASGSMDPNLTDVDLSGRYPTNTNPDANINKNVELNMDLIMTEAIAEYTLLEMLYTLKLEDYTSANIRKLSDKMIHAKIR